MNRTDTLSTSRQASLLVAFMWVAYFLNYCDRQAISAMFPVLKSDLEMTDFQLGLTGTVFLWVYGCGCPIAGQLADKFSKRQLVVLSLAVWSMVTIATGLATSAMMLLALRAAMGISESLYMPAAVALTANFIHRKDDRGLSLCLPRRKSRERLGVHGSAAGWHNRGNGERHFLFLEELDFFMLFPIFCFCERYAKRLTATFPRIARRSLWLMLSEFQPF